MTAKQRPNVPTTQQLIDDPGLASASVTVLKLLRDEIAELREVEQAFTEVLKQHIALSGDPYKKDGKCLRDDSGNCAIVSNRTEIKYDLVTASKRDADAVIFAARANVLSVKDAMVRDQRANGMGQAWADALWQFRTEVKGGGATVLSFEKEKK